MANNLKLLNGVKDLVIGFANDNGISLRDEFKTVEAFQAFVFALTFKMLVDTGKTTQEAFDLVGGDGSYKKLANDVWTKLQAN